MTTKYNPRNLTPHQLEADLSTKSENVGKKMYEAFAREVIGWSSFDWREDILYTIESDGTWRVFAPLQLENVLKWVEGWCDEYDKEYEIYFTGCGDYKYTVKVACHEDSSDSLGVALIAACLDAELDRAQDHKVMP